jgi:hypothetical protein
MCRKYFSGRGDQIVDLISFHVQMSRTPRTSPMSSSLTELAGTIPLLEKFQVRKTTANCNFGLLLSILTTAELIALLIPSD